MLGCGGLVAGESSGGAVIDGVDGGASADASSASTRDAALAVPPADDASTTLYNANPPMRMCPQKSTIDGTMVPIDDGHGGAFCMDATEVTQAGYLNFISSHPPPSTVPGCENKTSYLHEIMDGVEPCDTPTFGGELPIECVDWCDAATYCKWSGKRLCGAIGGGSIDDSLAEDPTRDQWYRACSAGGLREYPYGNQYEPAYCNAQGSQSSEFGSSELVSFFENCLDATHRVYDLSGNVEEWEDSCVGDTCRVRGGAYSDIRLGALSCGSPATAVKTDTQTTRGFRCCAD
jgi:formylglycine-generating enzyme required for sulfatase activity